MHSANIRVPAWSYRRGMQYIWNLNKRRTVGGTRKGHQNNGYENHKPSNLEMEEIQHKKFSSYSRLHAWQSTMFQKLQLMKIGHQPTLHIYLYTLRKPVIGWRGWRTCETKRRVNWEVHKLWDSCAHALEHIKMIKNKESSVHGTKK